VWRFASRQWAVGSTQFNPQDPLSYTPKHLADKILQSKSALEGERKQVTVLFADVKGSMELAEQLDPEQWHTILDRFFTILTEGVHRFEGTVNQYTGDGIMALFGAPIAHEDHARRACYAALHPLDGLRAYANELRLRRGLNFSARIGINSGEVIVGKIGNDLRMDYTAQGHTVGLAARMEQIAEPGKVYLTAHTAALIQGYFALADLGEMEIKGVQGAMHVYELQGLGQMRTRLDVSRSRGFSRFVGRGDEMHVLETALARGQCPGGPALVRRRQRRVPRDLRRERAATRDLWLLNFRPEYQARWMQRSYYQHLPLQPLAPDVIRQLLRDELGDAPSVGALPEMIHTRTKGNPFFIEEVVQRLIESGHLTNARGAYRLTTPVDALQVPATLQAVLAARIDRLAEREKQVLQTAAVIGKTFDEALLRRVLGSLATVDETAFGAGAVRADRVGVPLRSRALSRGRIFLQAPADAGGGRALAAARASRISLRMLQRQFDLASSSANGPRSRRVTSMR
jgi:class 3 adenylate cyclase